MDPHMQRSYRIPVEFIFYLYRLFFKVKPISKREASKIL